MTLSIILSFLLSQTQFWLGLAPVPPFVTIATTFSHTGSGGHNLLGTALPSECDFQSGDLFLVASDTLEGKRGWLLCRSRNANEGWLYDSPEILSVHFQSGRQGASMHGSTDQNSGRHYEIDGEIVAAQFRGNLKRQSDDVAHPSIIYALYGSKLDPQSMGKGAWFIGRYSNVEYVEESGDLIGSELLLFSSNGRRTGLITFYESYWGEPTLTPLVLENVETVSRQKLRFDLRLAGSVGKYFLAKDGNSVVLSRTDVASAPDTEPVKLRRQDSLLPEKILQH